MAEGLEHYPNDVGEQVVRAFGDRRGQVVWGSSEEVRDLSEWIETVCGLPAGLHKMVLSGEKGSGLLMDGPWVEGASELTVEVEVRKSMIGTTSVYFSSPAEGGQLSEIWGGVVVNFERGEMTILALSTGKARVQWGVGGWESLLEVEDWTDRMRAWDKERERLKFNLGVIRRQMEQGGLQFVEAWPREGSQVGELAWAGQLMLASVGDLIRSVANDAEQALTEEERDELLREMMVGIQRLLVEEMVEGPPEDVVQYLGAVSVEERQEILFTMFGRLPEDERLVELLSQDVWSEEVQWELAGILAVEMVPRRMRPGLRDGVWGQLDEVDMTGLDEDPLRLWREALEESEDESGEGGDG